MKPIHKFNNGNGATLCNQCSVIITTNLTNDLYCEYCYELKTNTEFTQWIDKLKSSEIDTIDYDTYLRYDKKQLLEIFKKEKGL